MDPLTAALQLANTIAKIVLTTIEGMTPEQRAEHAAGYIADLEKWRQFLSLFAPKEQ